jgi:hypothetical protein
VTFVDWIYVAIGAVNALTVAFLGMTAYWLRRSDRDQVETRRVLDEIARLR